MFSQLKDRVINKIKDYGPQDELDKSITALVERGTSEQLLSPDWSVNMELVDLVNRYPEQACEKLIRIVARAYGKPNAKVQILALTMLDTCMRNCHPMLHVMLPASVLWADLVRHVQDTSLSRIDAEVRDKILAMIEDYGKWLKNPPTYAELYESFVDKGLDFPVRSPDEMVPIEPYQPPAYQPPVVQQQQQQQGGALGGLFGGLAPSIGTRSTGGRQAGATGAGGDPYAGLSEEDKAAVMAALTEMELEDSAAREAAAVAAAADAAEQAAQSPGATAAAGEAGGPGQPAPTAVEAPAENQSVVPQRAQQRAQARARRQEGPVLPADPAEALQVITNSVTLFSEMLGSVPDSEPSGVRDPVIAQLADTCGQYRSKLMELAGSVGDEGVLVGVLSQNDALATTLARYDELLARALSQPPAPATQHPVVDTAMRAAAVASAVVGGGAVGVGSAGPTFTLDEEEEEEGGGLATKRQSAHAAPATAAAAAAPPPAPAADPLGDLLGLGEGQGHSLPQGGTTVATPAAAAATAAGASHLVEDPFGGLVLHSGAQPAAATTPEASTTAAVAEHASSHGPLL